MLILPLAELGVDSQEQRGEVRYVCNVNATAMGITCKCFANVLRLILLLFINLLAV